MTVCGNAADKRAPVIQMVWQVNFSGNIKEQWGFREVEMLKYS